MYDIGRICIKLAGRDAKRTCAIVDIVNDTTVLIDGETRRRNCNIHHLYPTEQKLDISKNASHAAVVKAFAALSIILKESKPKKAAERPKKQKAKKQQAPTKLPAQEKLKKAASPEKKDEPVPKTPAPAAKKSEVPSTKSAAAKPALAEKPKA